MKIYTRTGDKGQTSLFRGGRVPKHDLRVETYGTVDELNSHLGFARAINKDTEVDQVLEKLQRQLHVLSSDIAAKLTKPGKGKKTPRIEPDDSKSLENEIDRFDKEIEPLTSFILPGGSEVGAALHIAMTVCRRAERRVTELSEQTGDVNPQAIIYLNRLSDLLFTFSRWVNARKNIDEQKWSI